MKDKILYFQEHQKFDFDKINSLLNNNEIKNLFEKKILKLGKGNKYYFEYVGILSLKSSMFILLPKYLSKSEILIERKENSPKTKLLIKVLKKYFSKNLNETFLHTIGEEEPYANLNKFALYDYLISDFIEYGFYENQKKVYEINGDGEINWKKTIEECQEFIIGNNLLYLDYFSNEAEADDKDYIKNLHRYYLNKASDFFKDISFLDLDYPIFNFEILDNLIEDISIQIFKIKKALQEEFSERKIRLLKLLLILIENDSKLFPDSINFYGTTAFYDVWEKACGSILGNQYEKYMNHISNPIWSDNIGNKFMKKTLRPDVIVVKKDFFFIFDAKYYNPIFSDGKDLPGIESISKQYLYELAFRNHLDYKNKIKRNIFLIPWNGEDIICEGKVSIDFLKKIGDIELQDIFLYKLPADNIFKLYIKDMRLSDDDYQKLEK